jgi:hypothetical protein
MTISLYPVIFSSLTQIVRTKAEETGEEQRRVSKKGREERRRVGDEQCREEKISEKNNREEPKGRTK